MTSPDRSIGVEKGAKCISGDVSAGLAKDGVAGSGIELAVVGNCQGLLFGGGTDPAQFDVASRLFVNYKTEPLKD
jgi:hypothetical protein